MSIREHVSEFAGLPVREYDPDEGITDPEGFAYRLSVDHDAFTSGERLTGRLARMLEDPAASRVRALVIGAWEDVFSSMSTSDLVKALVASAGMLPSLRALFLGDVTCEEAEISWIQQSDMNPLFDAYPRLEHFRVRGGSGLEIRSLRHESLRSLVVETGGLDAAVVRGIASSDLPRLEHLELWIGSSGYGKTATVDDFGPILQGEVFPALRYLGLRNCEEANEMAAAVAVAPILSRIKVLDLSLGDLDEEGVMALVASPAVARLEKLDIHHHFAAPEAIAVLESLGIAVDASEGKSDGHDDGDDDRYISAAE